MPPEDPTSAPTMTTQLWAELREAKYDRDFSARCCLRAEADMEVARAALREARAEIDRLKAELASVDAASRAKPAANESLKEQLQVVAQKWSAEVAENMRHRDLLARVRRAMPDLDERLYRAGGGT